jgi:acetyltransferase-like isoleucine patch superfamily enzyme
MTVRKAIGAFFLFLLPTALARYPLNGLGHRIARGASVGWSWVYCDLIAMDAGARIGHYNLVVVRRLLMRKGAYFGRGNVLRGPFDVHMKATSALGHSNRITRGGAGISTGPAKLVLGTLAKITAGHRVDCTRSVHFGAYSTLAGIGSQIWTHGYVHDVEGPGRYRVDGPVVIEENVYVGSGCLLFQGVHLGKGVILGGGTSVARSLLDEGLYVSAPIRKLPRPKTPDQRNDLRKVEDPSLRELVYLKRGTPK